MHQHVKVHIDDWTATTDNGQGGMTVSVKNKRVKFAGSLALPWSLTLVGGGGGGVGWLLGRALGQW